MNLTKTIIMKRLQFISTLVLLCGITAQAAAIQIEDSVYIESFGMRPGDTRFVEVFLDSSNPWVLLNTKISLPSGLEFVMITEDELEGTDYTMEHIFDPDAEKGLVFVHESYVVLSNKFKDRDYMLHDYYYNYLPQDEWPTLMFSRLTDNQLLVVVDNYEMYKISMVTGEHFPMALIKVHATDEFVPQSVIQIQAPLYTNYIDIYTGQPTTTPVEYGGKPSRMAVTKRPADISDVNKLINVMLGKPDAQSWGWYDTNSDGIVDITDVNAIINEMLGKTGYDVPTGNQGHDTEPRDNTR